MRWWARFDRPGVKIFNTYGPTEATVSASLAQLTRDKPVAHCRPLPNYGMLVLDEQQQPVPQGQTRRVVHHRPRCGARLSGAPELTAEKFLASTRGRPMPGKSGCIAPATCR